MRAAGSATRRGTVGRGWVGLGTAIVALGFGLGAARGAAPEKGKDAVAVGKEIFLREWLPKDPRSHGGDGLGPVYNDTSCVACHNQGATGGGGPSSKNIEVLNAFRNNPQQIVNFIQSVNAPQQANGAAPPQPVVIDPRPPANTDALIDFHAGFRNGRTVVLHRFGTDPNYEAWKRAILNHAVTVAQPMFAGNFQNFAVAVPGSGPVEQRFVRLAAPEAPPAPPAVVVDAPRSDVVTVEGQPVPNQVTETVVTRLAVPNDAPVAALMPFVSNGGNGMDRASTEIMRLKSEIQVRRANVATQVAAPVGEFTIQRSQRNPTALFGIGLIDSIPDAILEARANATDPNFPETKGRVSRLKDGKIGRLGWKGQTASTADFVLTACAVEVGLEVPDHGQSISPQAPSYKATGMDLTGDECAALVAYVKSLPAPERREASGPEEAKVIDEGKVMFASVGCASCHTPKLGEVDSLYSDLLLHDMGAETADTGSYNGGDPSSPDDDEPLGPIVDGSDPNAVKTLARGATKQEWRTPPLWGVRDSGPYLHDGRAETLDEAIALHGGQAAGSAQRYFSLSAKERLKVQTFLKSLVAPASQVVRAGD